MEESIKKARNFRNYKVWRDAVSYATRIYKVTVEMPWFEKRVYAINYKERLFL